MKRKTTNIYLVVAFIFYFISNGIGHFMQLPYIVKGFCTGMALAMFLYNLYTLNHDAGKLRIFKKKLIGRLIKY